MGKRTQAIHSGYSPDPSTGASAVPVYHTAAFSYSTAQELADVFAGRAPGNVYSRISNPTSLALEQRLAELENGVGCIATSSGMAAITAVMVALLQAGDEILSVAGLFGGTVSLFQNTLGRFGVSVRYADGNDADDFALAVTGRTRIIYLETIGNPGMNVPDIAGIARVAHEHNLPLVIDATLTPPAIVRTGELGADIVIHSTTKFINGHGTAIGGAIIDTGNYSWDDGQFHDLWKWGRKAGPFAFIAYLRNVVYRDLGGCPSPMNSFLMLQGLETLAPRMKLHCENARNLAAYLAGHPRVPWVNYPALPASPFAERVKAQFKGNGGSLLTFGLETKKRAFAFVDAVKLAKNMTNLGDVKTLVVHPASTIFHEYSPEERVRMGVPDDMLRVSVGIEDFEDIRADFEQAMEAAKE
ncbi:MAG: aminotransferase class I/II-fold pyridoxal phosphate-dependent enzyme [Candidatus Hydrogenedentes bacterium]|nr:aminotransferase class I/II-fold pyridoxal phosphate-dependent enzyme [Candidatus Hydrogenedentota bacterium]